VYQDHGLQSNNDTDLPEQMVAYPRNLWNVLTSTSSDKGTNNNTPHSVSTFTM